MTKLFICILLLLATAAPGWATAVVRLNEELPGHFLIEGAGLVEVTAFNLVIDYDPATLQISTVSAGAMLQGMLFAGNPNQPGRVQIGAVGTQPISGSGTLVKVSGRLLQQAGEITGFSAQLSDVSGRPIAVRVEYLAPSASSSPSAAEESVRQNSAEASSATANPNHSVPAHLGQVGIPAPWSTTEPDSTPADSAEPDIVPLLEEESQSSEIAETESPSAPYVEKRQIGYSSTLTAFENYTGPRTLAKMSALFQRENREFEQRPVILLADGEAAVEVELSVRSATEPSIALKNARLLRAAFVGENRFLVRCIPEQGALTAKILVLGGEQVVEIPLTIAPPVSIAGLEVLPNLPLPQFDMDRDEERTWIDDYILVANLLAQRRVKGGGNP